MLIISSFSHHSFAATNSTCLPTESLPPHGRPSPVGRDKAEHRLAAGPATGDPLILDNPSHLKKRTGQLYEMYPPLCAHILCASAYPQSETNTYACMHVCTYLHIHIYIYSYSYIHIYI